MADFLCEQLIEWVTPFEAMQGAGSINSEINAEFLFFGSSVCAVESSETIPPQLSNFVPAHGSQIGANTVLSFDVTDNTAFLRRIILHISLPTSLGSEVVHNGEGFNTRHYSNSSNTRTPIANGFRYTILRDGGWPAGPGSVTLQPFAIDYAGNENI